MNFKNKIIILASLLFAGCASIVSGTKQSITIETRYEASNIFDTMCEIFNNKGKWYVRTPGSVVVHRSYSPLHIKCTKNDTQPGMAVVHSKTKGMAFGNILFGGIIGAGVDMKTGAAYDYPNLISIQMGKIDLVIGKPPKQPKEKTNSQQQDEEE